ncbi:glucose-1-phosphate adenylyltransferase [Acidiplasma aeolicum]|uniref:Glucose-1-phosphate adenylyltransferase n=1 Tax=Acidiplasma aeolicum TaxID=507754 RepID=A0A0P9F4C7_9ARCH|nr:nucleotidyltransferase family protein [Acidiplasma aeolicum]KPV46536.1 glucose-1-phosphate adenylyltransferase [Acidiplasma aeolicum]
MIGAILAGGYGKRLKPLTDRIPKALIELKDNYTIMDRQLFDFKNAGINDVYVLSGYLGDKIEDRYRDFKDVNIHYLREEKPMGTLYSIQNLLENVNEDIILRNGDTVSDIDLNNFIDYSRNKNYGMIMYITKMKSPYGIVEFAGDRAFNFKEKPELNYYINAGIYYIKKNVFELFKRDYIEKDIEKSVFPVLVASDNLGVYKDDSLWMGIDSEKDLEAIRKEYMNRHDESFGYIKKIFNSDSVSILEYFIRKGSKIQIHDGGIIKIISGNGYILNDEKRKYDENFSDAIYKDFYILPYENTKIQIINFLKPENNK